MLRVPRGDLRLTVPKWPGLLLAIPLMGGGPGLVLAIAVGVFLLGAFVMVVCPAVWSKKEFRRKAALDVLRIFRKGG